MAGGITPISFEDGITRAKRKEEGYGIPEDIFNH